MSAPELPPPTAGASTSADPMGPAAPRSGGGWRAWAQIAFGVLAVGLLITTVIANWPAFIDALASMKGAWVAAAAVLILGGLYINMLSWRSVVIALGRPIGYAPAARVFFTSQIAKYIPGGIWPIVASSRLGRAAGLPATVSVISMSIALLVGVTVGAVYAVGALYLSPAIRENYWWAPVLLLVCGLVVLLPPILNRVIAVTLRLVRQESMPPVRRGAFAAAVLWSVVSWAMLGLALASLVASLVPLTPGAVVLCVASYAIAWVAGFLVLIAPAGAGVREVVLGLALATFLPASAVLGIVVVDRLLMTFGDVAMLLFTIRRRSPTMSADRDA